MLVGSMAAANVEGGGPGATTNVNVSGGRGNEGQLLQQTLHGASSAPGQGLGPSTALGGTCYDGSGGGGSPYPVFSGPVLSALVTVADISDHPSNPHSLVFILRVPISLEMGGGGGGSLGGGGEAGTAAASHRWEIELEFEFDLQRDDIASIVRWVGATDAMPLMPCH